MKTVQDERLRCSPRGEHLLTFHLHSWFVCAPVWSPAVLSLLQDHCSGPLALLFMATDKLEFINKKVGLCFIVNFFKKGKGALRLRWSSKPLYLPTSVVQVVVMLRTNTQGRAKPVSSPLQHTSANVCTNLSHASFEISNL